MRVLITGTAGFIGSTTAHKLLDRGDEVIGIDNLNDYYDVSLKQARLDRLTTRKGFTDIRTDLENADVVRATFEKHKPHRVINLAAQAGVRYSLENPQAYVDSNVTGFVNVIEGCRYNDVEHLVYASTSSVYGLNTNMPFDVSGGADHSMAVYAATKRCNELMAHSYSHLFRMPTTGLRFFTVYGPWGRPDMALFLFTRKILAGESIPVFNHGNHKRDFTYVDDIANGIIKALDQPAQPNPAWDSNNPDPASSSAPYKLYNIGNNSPVDLSHYISTLEDCLGKKAIKEMLPLQPGDVPDTYADVTSLVKDVDYKPATPVEVGIENFVRWYRDYYKV